MSDPWNFVDDGTAVQAENDALRGTVCDVLVFLAVAAAAALLYHLYFAFRMYNGPIARAVSGGKAEPGVLGMLSALVKGVDLKRKKEE